MKDVIYNMKNKQQLMIDIKKLAIEKVSEPKLLEFSIKKGNELALEYGADPDIVFIGLCFMDIKLKEALALNKQSEHMLMAVNFAKDFLKMYVITDEEKKAIINCIEAHHKTIPFQCIEAEICANADCYVFIHPFGVFIYRELLIKRGKEIKEQVIQLQNKLQEKYQIISLDKVKEELEEKYQMFLKIFNSILLEFPKE